MIHDKEFYEQVAQMEHEVVMTFWLRLQAVKREAEAELERIETHGGCAGFALRVLALAEGGRGDGKNHQA